MIRIILLAAVAIGVTVANPAPANACTDGNVIKCSGKFTTKQKSNNGR
jgi:hypothetical protein